MERSAIRDGPIGSHKLPGLRWTLAHGDLVAPEDHLGIVVPGEKCVDGRRDALGILREENAVFDFIYVDGSHQRDDVMIDCLGAWRLLREGGVMLMDDYTWKPDNPDSMRVAPAVDTFLAWHDDAEVILRSHQVAVRKRPA